MRWNDLSRYKAVRRWDIWLLSILLLPLSTGYESEQQVLDSLCQALWYHNRHETSQHNRFSEESSRMKQEIVRRRIGNLENYWTKEQRNDRIGQDISTKWRGKKEKAEVVLCDTMRYDAISIYTKFTSPDSLTASSPSHLHPWAAAIETDCGRR